MDRVTKKRKAAPEEDVILDQSDEDDSAGAGSSDEEEGSSSNDDDEEDGISEEDIDLDEDEPEASTSALKKSALPAHLLPSSTSKSTPGLIYISRIPPGLGPSKVKHLLSAYGEVGRIFLKRFEDASELSAADAQKKKKRRRVKEKHQSHRFEEGWVEFMDKKVARSVAGLLNAQPIGGKKNSRHSDDIWTMKYLPRFRWDELSAAVSAERQQRTQLLRFHIENQKKEREAYAEEVEKARVARVIGEKREAKRQRDGGEPVAAKPVAAGVEGQKKKKAPREEGVKREKKGAAEKEKALQSVLGSLF